MSRFGGSAVDHQEVGGHGGGAIVRVALVVRQLPRERDGRQRHGRVVGGHAMQARQLGEGFPMVWICSYNITYKRGQNHNFDFLKNGES